MDDAWLALVRAASAIGDMSSLLPPGIERLYDLPFTHAQAINAALNYLGFGELPKDERPPKDIWLDGEKLDKWFKEVERLREEKYGGNDQGRMEKSAIDVRKLLIVGEDED